MLENPQAMTYLPISVDPPSPGKTAWDRLHLAVPNVVPGVVNAVSNALLAPGETLTGRAPLGNSLSKVPDPVKAANDLTGLALGTGLSLPGESGAFGMFMGKASKTANHEALETAKQWENLGKPPELTRMATGWARGVDGQWKYVEPDVGADGKPIQLSRTLPETNPDNIVNIKHLEKAGVGAPGAPVTVGDLIPDHKALFLAYPEAKNLPVYHETSPHALGSAGPNFIKLAPGKPETVVSTLLHEVQHWIQDREGFGRGGAVSEFLPEGWEKNNRYYTKSLARSQSRLGDDITSRMISQGTDPDKAIEYGWQVPIAASRALSKLGRGVPLEKSETDTINALLVRHPDDMADLMAHHQSWFQNALQGEAAQKKYFGLAGEVEARTTQEMHAQGDWGPEAAERYSSVPERDQTVRGAGIEGFDWRKGPAVSPEAIKAWHGTPHVFEPVEGEPFARLEPVEEDPFSPKSLGGPQ
jgi:hypothetical protein